MTELLSYVDGPPSIPSEFYQFKFHTVGTTGSDAEKEITKIVDWVYMVKQIPETIRNLAAQYVMSSNQGREMLIPKGDTAKAAGAANTTTDFKGTSVDASIRMYIHDLKNFKTKVVERVVSVMAFWSEVWTAADTASNKFRGTVDSDTNKSLIGEMSTPQRFKMVAEHIAREFELQLSLIAKKYPTVQIFGGYLQQAFTGKAGVSLPSAGGPAAVIP